MGRPIWIMAAFLLALPAAFGDDLSPADRAAAAKKWKKQIVAWYDEAKAVPQGEDYSQVEEILARIEGIRDPLAIPAMDELLKEQKFAARLHLVEALGNMPSTRVLKILVRVSCEDNDPQSRKRAAELITTYPARDVREAIPQYCRYIVGGRFRGTALEALKNAKIADQVSQGDVPNRQLVFTLINTLFTKEEGKVPVYRYYDTGWYRRAGGAMHREGRGRVELVPFTAHVPRREVLEVLKTYSGQDYGFHEQSWRKWYQQHYERNKANAPR